MSENPVYGICGSKCLHETIEKTELSEYITELLSTLNYRPILVGTAAPSGGVNGDVYIQIL